MQAIFKMCIHAIFPPRCIVCSSYTGKNSEFETICDHCFKKISVQTGFLCPTCDKRIPQISDICHKKNFLLISTGSFHNEMLQKIIHTFKYRSIRKIAIPLGRMLAQSFSSIIDEIPFSLDETYIIPIPLSKNRMRERGFNQSELIAYELSKYINVPIKLDCLFRKNSSHTQAHATSASERKQFVDHIFFTKGDIHSNIILVDDVYTTGSTIEDAVRALKEAGCKRVLVTTIAKT